ncbi:MAG: protein-disulfide reductase DsbD family protein, partial [Rhodospirillales bacterium]|nr:protein-disulfide reductase DsbD family protein [Rhodospirillales bacterium]
MRMILSTFGLVALMFTALSPSAQAASSAWAITDHTRLRLISQTDAIGSEASITLGLHFELDEHWKIYWRSPGDAGFPPSVTLEGSVNAEQATLHWPLPERFSILNFETLGYATEVVVPMTVALNHPGEAVMLKAQVSYLACAEICIPYDAELTLELPAQTASSPAPSAEAHLLNRFQAQVPKPGPSQGLNLERVEFKADGPKADTGTLYITASSTNGFNAPDVYVEGPELLAFAKPRTGISEDGKTAIMEIPFEGLQSLKIPFTDALLTLTLVDAPQEGSVLRGAEFINTQASPASSDTLALADDLPKGLPAGPPLLAMLGLALLGGVILNLMPCVLPVLSIKLLSVVGHGGARPRTVRISFLASAAGIMTSFLVLAAVLIALKGAGLAIGWGIQFQHPWFLVAMALVVTLFACNLW